MHGWVGGEREDPQRGWLVGAEGLAERDDGDVVALAEHIVRQVELDERAVRSGQLAYHDAVEWAEPLAAQLGLGR
eukprot:1211551-Prymnesium_polylepis.1